PPYDSDSQVGCGELWMRRDGRLRLGLAAHATKWVLDAHRTKLLPVAHVLAEESLASASRRGGHDQSVPVGDLCRAGQLNCAPDDGAVEWHDGESRERLDRLACDFGIEWSCELPSDGHVELAEHLCADGELSWFRCSQKLSSSLLLGGLVIVEHVDEPVCVEEGARARCL